MYSDVQVIWRCRKCNKIYLPELPEVIKGKDLNMERNILQYPDNCHCGNTFFDKELNWIKLRKDDK